MSKYDYSGLNEKIIHRADGSIPIVEIDQSSISFTKKSIQGLGWVETNGEMVKSQFRYTGNFNIKRPENIIFRSAQLSILGYGSCEMTGLDWKWKDMEAMTIRDFMKKTLQENDIVIGTKYNDIINGYRGNDLIIGGAGRNLLKGGKGYDTFVLHKNGVQIIKDFSLDDDTVDFNTFTNAEMELESKGKDSYMFMDGQLVAILKGYHEAA